MDSFLLVDTSVLVAAERGKLPLDSLHKVSPGVRLAISIITVSELWHGCFRARPKSRKISRERFVEALLDEIGVVPVDLRVAREHARIWASLSERGELIGPYDLIIAATALAYRAPLATLNEGEFRRVKGLRLQSLRPFLRA